MRRSRRALKVVAILAMFPLAVALAASLIAGLLGCEINEGGTAPCVVAGTDVGGLLSGLLTLGWMALLTIPILMLAVGAWALAEWWVWSKRRRRERRQLRKGQA